MKWMVWLLDKVDILTVEKGYHYFYNKFGNEPDTCLFNKKDLDTLSEETRKSTLLMSDNPNGIPENSSLVKLFGMNVRDEPWVLPKHVFYGIESSKNVEI